MEFESPTNDEPQNFLLRSELIFHFHFLIYSFIYLPFLIRSTFVRALLQGVSNWEHKIECVYAHTEQFQTTPPFFLYLQCSDVVSTVCKVSRWSEWAKTACKLFDQLDHTDWLHERRNVSNGI